MPVLKFNTTPSCWYNADYVADSQTLLPHWFFYRFTYSFYHCSDTATTLWKLHYRMAEKKKIYTIKSSMATWLYGLSMRSLWTKLMKWCQANLASSCYSQRFRFLPRLSPHVFGWEIMSWFCFVVFYEVSQTLLEALLEYCLTSGLVISRPRGSAWVWLCNTLHCSLTSLFWEFL